MIRAFSCAASMSLVAIFAMGSPVVFALYGLLLDRAQAIP
jgi:hypothetical protein